jgi:hypothetical protein
MSVFFSGSLDPTWPHIILLGIAIVSSFAVAIGIVLENPKWSLPNALVVGGVAIEAVCTLLLFGFDEGISRAQQASIGKQQTTIEQLLAHRKLSPEQKQRLIAVTKNFPSLNFQTIAVPESEPWDFVMEIAAVLSGNGWNWIPCEGPLPKMLPQDGRPASCWTILDHIQIDGTENLSDIVHSLEVALADPAVIGMTDVRPEISPAFPTIVIMVGTK